MSLHVEVGSVQSVSRGVNSQSSLSQPITVLTRHVNAQSVLCFKPSITALTRVACGRGKVFGLHVSLRLGQVTRVLSTNVAAIPLSFF